MNNNQTLEEISAEINKVIAQSSALSEEVQNWKVSTAPLATNDEIKELYDNATILFDRYLDRINAQIYNSHKSVIDIEARLANGENCDKYIRKLNKEMTKLDLLAAGLEAYLYFCKKDVKEIVGDDEFV